MRCLNEKMKVREWPKCQIHSVLPLPPGSHKDLCYFHIPTDTETSLVALLLEQRQRRGQRRGHCSVILNLSTAFGGPPWSHTEGWTHLSLSCSPVIKGFERLMASLQEVALRAQLGRFQGTRIFLKQILSLKIEMYEYIQRRLGIVPTFLREGLRYLVHSKNIREKKLPGCWVSESWSYNALLSRLGGTFRRSPTYLDISLLFN